jgi:tetratricopeptide (TPR) repeat protein/uncharacterized RDD family membrane protein YckC
MSQSSAAPAPLAVNQIAEQSGVTSLLLRRWIGALIDLLVLLSAFVVPAVVLGERLFDATALIWVGAAILYFPMFEGIWGRSLGKLITGTMVVDEAGRAPGLFKAALRTLLRLFEVNPFLLGGLPAGITVMTSKRRQRLGDMLARTYVVRVKDLRRGNVAFGATSHPALKAFACVGVLGAAVLATFGLSDSERAQLRDAWQRPQRIACTGDDAAVMKCDPKDAADYNNRGVAYYHAGELDRAVADLDEAIRLNPRLARAYSNRGLAYDDKGDPERAITDYNEAIRLDPKLAIAYSNRASVYDDKGDYARAIADYNEAIRLDPGVTDVYNNRGTAYYHMVDLDHALADFNEAIRLNPDRSKPYANRGFAYEGKGDHDRAMADFKEAIRLDNGNSDIGNIIAERSEAIRLNPKFAYNRASVYAAKADYGHAIASYDEAIAFKPEDANAFLGRGSAYLAQSELDNALADYSEAIRLDPNFTFAYVNRSVVHGAMGALDRTVEDSSAAIRLNPKFTNAYRTRGFAYLYSGAFAMAAADLKRANELDQLGAIGAIWVDFAERRANIPSHLAQDTATVDMTAWPAPILRMFLGQMTPEAVRAAAAADPDKKGRLCEVNFYAGEFALMQGGTDEATRLFQLAKSDCPPGSLEWVAARAEVRAAGVTQPERAGQK